MSITTTSVHNVKRITFQLMTFESFTSHSLTFHLADGSTHEVCGFSAEPVTIEMLPNQVAAPLETA